MEIEANENLNRIIAGCRRGNNEAFSQLVDMYAKRCYGYFYRLCGNAAISNDLLSELFLRIVTRIGSFKGGSFEKWLFTTASNIFNDYLRSEYRQKKVLKAKAEELKAPNGPEESQDEMCDRLQSRLGRLDADTAELLMLRFYGQLSFKELSSMRAEPIGTTLAKVHRGLKRLRKLMEEK